MIISLTQCLHLFDGLWAMWVIALFVVLGISYWLGRRRGDSTRQADYLRGYRDGSYGRTLKRNQETV